MNKLESLIFVVAELKQRCEIIEDAMDATHEKKGAEAALASARVEAALRSIYDMSDGPRGEFAWPEYPKALEELVCAARAEVHTALMSRARELRIAFRRGRN